MRNFDRLRRGATIAALIAASCTVSTVSARGDAVADFYRGRTLVLITGSAAGGGYDFSLRLLAEFIKRHIPGGPNVIVENKVGAAGRNAMTYVYNVAPKDGTQAIMPFNVDPIFQLLRPTGIKYDLRRMAWLGNMAELFNVVAFSSKSGVTSLDDAKKREVVMASSGRSSQTYMVPVLFNAVLGTKFKVVTGYAGTRAIMLAMERGEAEGRVGTYESWTESKADWIRDRRVLFVAQDGLERSKALPKVPLYEELVTDPQAKAMLRFMSFPVATSRTVGLAPGVPADRVAALRKAFWDTMQDPAFRAAADKRHMEIEPSPHDRVEKVIAEIFATPPALVARLQAILQFK